MEHVKDIQCDPGRLPAFALAEIAFLVSLTSADSNVSRLAAKGLRLLSHAERQAGAPVNPGISDEDRLKRHRIYDQLGDPNVMVVGAYLMAKSVNELIHVPGRVGHQKRIRQLVRLIAYPSAAHIAVWEECYWRWRSLTELMIESLNEAADDSQNHVPMGTQV
jgi:neurofibromin 1